MSCGPFNMDAVRAYIRAKLGECAINVELEDKHIDACIKDAVGLINQYCPIKRPGFIAANAAGKHILTHKNLQVVTNVTAVRNRTEVDAASIDLFDPMIYITGSVLAGATSLATYQAATEYIRTARSRIGSELEWTGYWMPNDAGCMEYCLFIASPPLNRMVYGYEYLVHLEATDDPEAGIMWVPFGLQDWFRSYALSEAKYVLAGIRGKFMGIPSPEGSDMQLNAEEIRGEAIEDKNRLIDIISSQRPTIGMVIG